jgi:hypothetical protein
MAKSKGKKTPKTTKKKMEEKGEKPKHPDTSEDERAKTPPTEPTTPAAEEAAKTPTTVGDETANAENMEVEDVTSIPIPPPPADNAAEDNIVTVRDDEVDELLAMSGDEDQQDPLADARVETASQQPGANQPQQNVVVSKTKSSNIDNVGKDSGSGSVDKNVTNKSKSVLSGGDKFDRDRNNKDQEKRLGKRDDLGARKKDQEKRLENQNQDDDLQEDDGVIASEIDECQQDYVNWTLTTHDQKSKDLLWQAQLYLRNLNESQFLVQTKSRMAIIKDQTREVFTSTMSLVRMLYLWVKRVNHDGYPIDHAIVQFVYARAKTCLEVLALLFEDALDYIKRNLPEYYAHCFDLFVVMKDRTKRVLKRSVEWQHEADNLSELSSLRSLPNVYGNPLSVFGHPLKRGEYEEANRERNKTLVDQTKDFRKYKPETGLHRSWRLPQKINFPKKNRDQFTPDLDFNDQYRPPVDGATGGKSANKTPEQPIKPVDELTKRWINEARSNAAHRDSGEEKASSGDEFFTPATKKSNPNVSFQPSAFKTPKTPKSLPQSNRKSSVSKSKQILDQLLSLASDLQYEENRDSREEEEQEETFPEAPVQGPKENLYNPEHSLSAAGDISDQQLLEIARMVRDREDNQRTLRKGSPLPQPNQRDLLSRVQGVLNTPRTGSQPQQLPRVPEEPRMDRPLQEGHRHRRSGRRHRQSRHDRDSFSSDNDDYDHRRDRSPDDPDLMPPANWYQSLPRPWNKIPREPEKKLSDYLKTSKFATNTFGPKPELYFSWRSEFITSIHLVKTTIPQKIKYMRRTLCETSDHTATLCETLADSTTAETYKLVIESLEERFGGPNKLLLVRSQQMDNYPNVIEGDVKTLTGFIDHCQNLINELGKQGLGREVDTKVWFHKIYDRLPTSYLEAYENYCFIAGQDSEVTSTLLNWMRHHLRMMNISRIKWNPKSSKSAKKEEKSSKASASAEKEKEKPYKASIFVARDSSDSESSSDSEEETDNDSYENTLEELNQEFAGVSTDKKKSFDPICPICKVKHLLVECNKFKKQMNSSERKEVIMDNKLCLRCFKEHYIKDCQSRIKCSKCSGKHHVLLHPETKTDDATHVATAPDSGTQ